MTDAVDRFRAGQADQLAQLRAAVADRAEHAEYLEALVEQGFTPDPPAPWRGVSWAVVDALVTDMEWITAEPPPPGWQTGTYPGAYAALRLRNARAAAKAARTRDAAPFRIPFE